MSTPETRSLVIEKELPHPMEKIWRALTQGPLIKQWLMDNDFQPEDSGRRAAPVTQGFNAAANGFTPSSP